MAILSRCARALGQALVKTGLAIKNPSMHHRGHQLALHERDYRINSRETVSTSISVTRRTTPLRRADVVFFWVGQQPTSSGAVSVEKRDLLAWRAGRALGLMHSGTDSSQCDLQLPAVGNQAVATCSSRSVRSFRLDGFVGRLKQPRNRGFPALGFSKSKSLAAGSGIAAAP